MLENGIYSLAIALKIPALYVLTTSAVVALEEMIIVMQDYVNHYQ